MTVTKELIPTSQKHTVPVCIHIGTDIVEYRTIHIGTDIVEYRTIRRMLVFTATLQLDNVVDSL